MSDLGRPISEDDLHSYVDRLLDPGRVGAVEHHLRENAEAAAMVAAMSHNGMPYAPPSPRSPPNRFPTA